MGLVNRRYLIDNLPGVVDMRVEAVGAKSREAVGKTIVQAIPFIVDKSGIVADRCTDILASVDEECAHYDHDVWVGEITARAVAGRTLILVNLFS